MDPLPHSGLILLGQVRSADLPSPLRAWRITASGDATPAVTVPLADPDLATRVDAEWLRLARRLAVLDADDTFLISTAGLPVWTRVRWTEQARLAQHLTGAGAPAGQAEFVTMAPDGTALCGATTEEYAVWLVADTERLHAPAPPIPDLDTLRTLSPMQVDLCYAPDRLRHPYRDGPVLLGVHRVRRTLVRLHEVPDQSEPHDGTLPLTDEQALVLGDRLGVPIDTARLSYYLEHQTGTTKSEQNTARRVR